MTIKITTPNGGSDSLDFGCAQTPVVATVTGTEVSSGEGKLEFKTTTGGTSATKATVLANGNFGINVAAPTQKLDVNGGINLASTQLLRWSNAGTLVGGIYIDNSNNMVFSNTLYNTERMRITSAGNVGIGTTTPTNGKLEVTHSSATVPAGHFRNTSGSGDSPALIVQGGANNTGGNFQVKDYAGNVDFQVGGDGTVTLGTPLPEASGGTGTFAATGGTVTTSGAYTIHTFTSNGIFTVTGSKLVDYLIVAGGGAGGYWHSGGGGAGGLLTGTGFKVIAQSYPITIGAGGSGTPDIATVGTTSGYNGENSSALGLTAIGGGRGGNYTSITPSKGGSGGGGNGTTHGDYRFGAEGIAGQGHAGGTAVTNHGGGGGGGAGGGGGGTGNTNGAVGGVGVANSYSGASVYYAGGGGGGSWQNTSAGGAGGNGGGGNGSFNYNAGAPTAGAANTGGGGGGCGGQGNNTSWAAESSGGSGIVIIRYLT